MTERDRPLDLVLFGVTGYTGRLVAERLAARAPAGLRMALAGRDAAKLASVRGTLGPRWASAETLVVDALDGEAMAGLASRTRAVVTTVGPYAKRGLPLVSACADAGTHYCDLTGESTFVRRSIDHADEAARASGAAIVHCAGFDSIPSDLGVLELHRAYEAGGAKLGAARLVVVRLKGGASGGTIASMLELFEEASGDDDVRRLLANPYALDPDPARRGPDGRDFMGVRKDPDLGTWVGPFVMAAINTRIVRRSNALLGFPYGEGFRYEEVQSFGPGPKGLARASAFVAGMGAVLGAAVTRPGRALLGRALPAPGEGPSAEAREAGSFHVAVFGEPRDPGGPRLVCDVRGTSDPGYGETSKMLAETGLLLASGAARRAGVLTPASALGHLLTEKLREVGLSFDVRAA